MTKNILNIEYSFKIVFINENKYLKYQYNKWQIILILGMVEC